MDALRSPPQVITQLKRKREAQRRQGRDFRLRPPRQIEPKNVERLYRKATRERRAVLNELVQRFLLERLGNIIESNKSDLPRRDALADDLFILINSIKIEFGRSYPDFLLRARLKDMGLAVSKHNKEQFAKTLKTTLAVDLFASEPWLTPQIENFIEQNVGLIKSVDERYFGDIQETVFRGARRGLSTQEIAQEIRDKGDVSQSRAELIARDQVNKFNGQLSEIRQTEVGVSRYRWRTSLDERVREEHAAREGKIFEWDDPPDDGHPGEAINCRCYAEPILEDLIDEEG